MEKMPTKKRPAKPNIRVHPTHESAAAELEKVQPEQLIRILLGASDQKFVALGNALISPQCNKYSLVQLCSMRQIHMKDVAELFKENQLAAATIRQMQHAEPILETNAKAAIGREVPCPTCHGRKSLYAP